MMSQQNNFYDSGVRKYESGNLDAALELFRKHTRVQPSDHRGFIVVGVILEGQGFVEQAVESFSLAARLKEDAELHVNLGKTLQKLRQKGRATDEEKESGGFLLRPSLSTHDRQRPWKKSRRRINPIVRTTITGRWTA